jgi:CheY-like chemotaxis protein
MIQNYNPVRAKELAQARVLVIDQDAETLGFAKWALNNAKVSAVRTMADAEDALAALGDFRPDLVLIELNLGAIDGVEFVRRVRAKAIGSLARLPIVMMTKSADAAQIEAACGAGLNNVIAKPFTAETLLSRIRSTLRHPDRLIEFTASLAASDRTAGTPTAEAEAEAEAEAAPEPRAVKPAPRAAAPRPAAKPRDGAGIVAAPREPATPAAARHGEDVPPTDTPEPEADRRAQDVPLAEPPPETPSPEVDGAAAEIAKIISSHAEWLATGGKSGERADIHGADLSGRDFSGRDLANASFRNADLQDADFGGANLHSADLRDADLSAAWLAKADLQQAKLRRAKLRAANLSGANLKDADFAGADCTNADFSGADVTRANFLGANLAGADLRGEELTQTQLTKAIADATTKLPGGLRLPAAKDDEEK